MIRPVLPTTCRVMRSTRLVISAAARREKVISENPTGICTVDDQMSDAMRQGICLPGARARDDEERFTRGGVLILDAVLGGSSLLRIERLEVGSGHRASQSGI